MFHNPQSDLRTLVFQETHRACHRLAAMLLILLMQYISPDLEESFLTLTTKLQFEKKLNMTSSSGQGSTKAQPLRHRRPETT